MTAASILIPVRPCTKCGACNRTPSGACRPCAKIRSAAWAKANPEKVKAKTEKWLKANPGRRKELVDAWYVAHKDERNAASAAWQKANPEKTRAYSREWYRSNSEKVNAATREWRAANPGESVKSKAQWVAANIDKIKAQNTAWRKANITTVRAYYHNRQARKTQAGGSLSRGLADKLFQLQKGKCPCCGLPLGDDFHMDHKTPIVLGGSNTDDNIQLLRKTCNLQKGGKNPVDFMQERGFLL